MKETRPLETVIADWMENAQAARRIDQPHDAELIERIIREVKASAEDYLREVSEEQAINLSGKTREWLRSRFEMWRKMGHAWRKGRKRYYRALIIPRRVNADSAPKESQDQASAA